ASPSRTTGLRLDRPRRGTTLRQKIPRKSGSVLLRLQGESLALPALVGDPLVEPKRLDAVERGGVETKMPLEQRAPQAAGDRGVPDPGAQLGPGAHPIRMELTPTDRRPGLD